MSSNYALKPCASNCQPGSDLLQIFFMEAIFWILRGARAKKKVRTLIGNLTPSTTLVSRPGCILSPLMCYLFNQSMPMGTTQGFLAFPASYPTCPPQPRQLSTTLVCGIDILTCLGVTPVSPCHFQLTLNP